MTTREKETRMNNASTLNEPTILEVPFDAIDAGNVAQFRLHVQDALVEGARIVLDLSHCEFVDSAGLGAIVWAVRRLAELGGEFCICGVNKPVQALFELVRMHKVANTFETRQQAVDSLAR